VKETCTVRVRRIDPSKGGEATFSEYDVPRTEETSALDALLYIRDNIDGTLAVNYSCKKQRCGSCALEIDGKVALGCFTPLRDGQTIAPLPGFSVVRDLVVDWTPYEKKLLELLPSASQEVNPIRVATKRESEIADSAATCIRCFSCVGACPSVDITGPVGFAGPAISVALASYLDTKESARGLAESAVEAGLEFCTRCFACNEVCPAGIDVVASIRALQDLAAESGPEGRALKQMVRGHL